MGTRNVEEPDLHGREKEIQMIWQHGQREHAEEKRCAGDEHGIQVNWQDLRRFCSNVLAGGRDPGCQVVSNHGSLGRQQLVGTGRL